MRKYPDQWPEELRKPWKELTDAEKQTLKDIFVFFQCWCPDKGEPKTMNSCGWGFGFEVPKDRMKDVEAFASVAIDDEMRKREEYGGFMGRRRETPSVILIAERDMDKGGRKRGGIKMKFRKNTLRISFVGGGEASTYSYERVA